MSGFSRKTGYTNNLAVAILGNPQDPSSVTYTNDGKKCYEGGKAVGFCDWANFDLSTGELFITTAGVPCQAGTPDCNLDGTASYSIWVHHQTDKYFVVMDAAAHDLYCNPPYSETPYNFCFY